MQLQSKKIFSSHHYLLINSDKMVRCFNPSIFGSNGFPGVLEGFIMPALESSIS